MTADFVSDTSGPLEPARATAGSHWRPDRWTVIGAIPIAFVVAWVLFFARGTSAGSAVSEPGEFVVVLLDGLTSAGLYFIVAAGFTLIFGLMRTVNMAHGALFLLAAYIAVEVQQRTAGGGVLWCDGRRTAQLPPRSRIEVTRGRHPLLLARLSDGPFTDRLVAKFRLPVTGWRGPDDGAAAAGDGRG